MSWEFIVTSLIVIVSPGTGVIYTLAAALSRGARASIVAALGCTLGIVPHIAAAVLGLAALLHASAVAFQTVKILGVAYLLFMAWQAWRERGPLKVDARVDAQTALRVIVEGILINILNPKLSIFFLAFLPQFVEAGDAHSLAHMLELSLVFMVMTWLVFALYGLAAARVRDHLVTRPKAMMWMRGMFAAAFAGLAARLAFAAR